MSLTRSDVDYISDRDSAARAYLELRHAIDTPGTPHGRLTEHKAALNKLERIFPDAAEHAATASDDDLGGLSPALKRTRDQHRRTRGVTAQQAAGQRRREHRGAGAHSTPRRPAPRTTRAPAARRAPSTRGLRRSAGRAAEFTAPAGLSAARLAWQTFGWGVGLSMLYLLVTNAQRAPRGKAAVEVMAKGVSNTITALVSPLADPLSPTRRPAAARAPAPSAVRPAAGSRDLPHGAAGHVVFPSVRTPSTTSSDLPHGAAGAVVR
jgi:hypothetical protein